MATRRSWKQNKLMNSFDFSYHDFLPTDRIHLARMTRSPVAETKDRPALVFMHGSMQGAWCYSHWLKTAHEVGIAVVAIDVRGHGGLPNEDLFTAGFNEYGDDVAAIAQTFDHPPVLLGHSMSGLMVGVAATRTPAFGLLLLTPSPLANLPGAEAVKPGGRNAPCPRGRRKDCLREVFA